MGGDGDLEPLSREITSASGVTATTGGHSYEEGIFNPQLVRRAELS